MSYELSGRSEYQHDIPPEVNPPAGNPEAFMPASGLDAEPTVIIPTDKSALEAVPTPADSDTGHEHTGALSINEMIRPEAAAEVLPADFNSWEPKNTEEAELLKRSIEQAPIIGRHMLVGGHVLNDTYMQKAATTAGEQYGARGTYPHTVKPAGAEHKADDLIQAGIERLSAHLDTPISTGGPYVYLFDTREQLNTVRSQMRKTPDGVAARGFHNPRKGIFITRENGQYFTHVLAHEIVHASSLQMHVITAAPADELAFKKPMTLCDIGAGYQRPDVIVEEGSIGLNEAITQLAAIRLLKEGKHDNPYAYSHCGNDILLDSVIKETAAFHDASPQEIDDALVKGLFNGDLAGVQLAKEALGPERWKSYVSLPSVSRSWRVLPIARQLGLDDAADVAEQTRQDGKFRIYDWLR